MFYILNIIKSIFKNPVILIILLPTILVGIWFREGNILGTGESGLPFYDLNLQFEINKSAWASYAFGHPTNISVASAPTYYFLSLFQKAGISAYLIQASFFWLVLVISGIGIYLLTKELFPQLSNRFLTLAVLFYWFNLYSMINVWNRFLNNFFFFYAIIPLALYLFILGINKQRYFFAILIGLLSIVSSYLQTSMALNLIFWLILIYTAIFYISRFTIKFFLLTLIFWLLINIWWISQVFSYISSGSFNAVSNTSFTTIGNYQTFINLSTTLGNISDLIRLRHDYFFNNLEISWVKIFNSPPVTLFNFLIAAIVLVPVIFIKNRSVFFAGGLFLIGMFLTKGNNPPFGEINTSIFLVSPLMQLFRNPFEKFGFILSLSSTLLFVEGLMFISGFVKKEIRELFYFSITMTIILIWGIPFLTRSVFLGSEKPINDPNTGYQVKVPEYYKQAAEWLKSQQGDFRLIVFPLGGEGITYEWEKGYSGVELTNQLLPKTAISLNTNIPFYDDVSKNIEKLFLTANLLPSLSNALNAKYILYRPDMDWEIRKMRNPKVILSVLEEKVQKGELKKAAQFGQLLFFQIPSKNKEEIYATSSALLSYSKPNISDLEFSRSNLVINATDKLKGIPLDKIEGGVIHPQAQFFLDHEVEPVFEIRQDIFPHVSTLPKEKIYPLVVIKDRLEEETIKDIEKLLDFRLTILGKRLVEAKLSADLNDEKGVIVSTKKYSEILDRTFKLIEELNMTDKGNRQASLQGRLYLLFSRQVKVLEDLINHFGLRSQTSIEIANTLEFLKTNLVQAYIYPFYGFPTNSELPIKRRNTYRFEVKTEGDYELLWSEIILAGYYKISENDQIVLQIDDNFLQRELKRDGKGHASLGKIYLEKGIHEIGLNLPEGKNLIEAPANINFLVDHASKSSRFTVKNYDPYSSYSINFDYWIKKGNGVQVSVYDRRPEDITSNTKPFPEFVVGPDLYDYTPKNFFKGFKLPDGIDQVTISLEVFPWNDCNTIFYSNKRERCKIEAFRRPYDKITEVDISNLSVSRNFTDLPMLVKKDSIEINQESKVEFRKLDSTTYQVDIKNSEKPFFLVFSKLFDPGWRLIDTDGKDLDYQHFLANSYSNSWYIEKTGDYQMILKFVPQQILKLGEKTSFIAVSLGVVFVVNKMIRRRNAKNN